MFVPIRRQGALHIYGFCLCSLGQLFADSSVLCITLGVFFLRCLFQSFVSKFPACWRTFRCSHVKKLMSRRSTVSHLAAELASRRGTSARTTWVVVFVWAPFVDCGMTTAWGFVIGHVRASAGNEPPGALNCRYCLLAVHGRSHVSHATATDQGHLSRFYVHVFHERVVLGAATFKMVTRLVLACVRRYVVAVVCVVKSDSNLQCRILLAGDGVSMQLRSWLCLGPKHKRVLPSK